MLFISGICIALLKRGNIAVAFPAGLDVRRRVFPLLFLPCYSNLCPLCVWQEVVYFPEGFFFFLLINFKSNFKRRVCRLLSAAVTVFVPQTQMQTCCKAKCCNTCWLTETLLTRQVAHFAVFHLLLQLHIFIDTPLCFHMNPQPVLNLTTLRLYQNCGISVSVLQILTSPWIRLVVFVHLVGVCLKREVRTSAIFWGSYCLMYTTHRLTAAGAVSSKKPVCNFIEFTSSFNLTIWSRIII